MKTRFYIEANDGQIYKVALTENDFTKEYWEDSIRKELNSLEGLRVRTWRIFTDDEATWCDVYIENIRSHWAEEYDG